MADRINIDGDDTAQPKRPPRGERQPRQPRATTPPKDGAKDDATPPPRRRTPQDRKVIESLTGTYQMVGGTVATFGMVRQDSGLVGTGTAIINKADVLADAWMDLADANPKVKDALRKFSEGSAAATVVALHLSCLMPILLDRGVIPESLGPMVMAQAGMSYNGQG